jgi:hypothetical protein
MEGDDAGGGLEAHILSFYEDVDMTIGELREVFDAVLNGHLEEVQEKMDGQALTFTVKNGVVEGFSKGASWKRVEAGGMTADMYEEKYADRPTVQHAYVSSMRALQDVVDADPGLSQRLFQDGAVVIETAMLVPSNPNTIPYERHHVRFIRAEALAPGSKVDDRAYAEFTDRAAAHLEETGSDVQIGPVPILASKRAFDAPDLIAELNADLSALTGKLGLNDANTLGDIIKGLVSERLEDEGLLPIIVPRVAARLMGDKAAFSASDAKKVGPGVWEKVQVLEKGPFVDEAMIPLERIIQKMGLHLFRNLEFVLASNDTTAGQNLRDAVTRVRQDFDSIKRIVDPRRAESIRVALARIGDNEADFEKAVEGVVFRWRGKLRKITGLFTAINKLRGFFAYSGNAQLAGYFERGEPLPEPPPENTLGESRMRLLQRNRGWVV